MTLEPREQRKHSRLSTSGGAYGIRFQIRGREVSGGRLANLSAGGCGLEVQMADARELEVGDLLESLYVDHPDLPLVPLSAVVLRILGKVPGKTSGYVLMGVEFQGLTPFVRDLIDGHVIAGLARD
ncbi:PilZ domain-containing protein [Geothrix sp. 21YS21S-4]|uniref:PilZ domain-containing protein n=1 Tax=Geothrix sp. 21YS21S-4 TaxID=3068889 RepID=UPI0027BA1F98|nr:PilZ domain-containing protein [Geothrix sp. 21YS21S-4]